MRTLAILTLAAALSAFCLTVFAQSASTSAGYDVIVNPDNADGDVDRKFLEDVFLKKVTSWPTGVGTRPVDLPPASPVRRRFTQDILRRSVEAVRSYWQKRIFAGQDVPPPELDTEEDVVTYVLKHEGAVGYVSPSVDHRGAKVLVVH